MQIFPRLFAPWAPAWWYASRCVADCRSHFSFNMSPDSPQPRSSRRLSGRRRWRSWVASYALTALIWPALGPLPWLDLDLAPGEPAAALPAATSDVAHEAHQHRPAASEIPGSPMHPADHDCFQCQVLKHMARCVLALPAAPAVAALSGAAVVPVLGAVAQPAPRIAALPPVRGPPLYLS
jgi:hypothetical protein